MNGNAAEGQLPTPRPRWIDSASDYGCTAKWLHWDTAALLLGSYCAVYFRRDRTLLRMTRGGSHRHRTQ